MSDLVWEDPPPDARVGRRPSKYWQDIADQLRSRPGQWARIYLGVRNGALANRVRKGQSSFAPAGAFEARETMRDGGWHVYARYVGEPEGGETP